MTERKGLPRAQRFSEVDRLVGQHLRERRSLLGLTAEELAGMVEVTDDKVRDFESGTQRISAEKLFDLSRVLNVHLRGFFYRPLVWTAAAAVSGSSCIGHLLGFPLTKKRRQLHAVRRSSLPGPEDGFSPRRGRRTLCRRRLIQYADLQPGRIFLARRSPTTPRNMRNEDALQTLVSMDRSITALERAFHRSARATAKPSTSSRLSCETKALTSGVLVGPSLMNQLRHAYEKSSSKRPCIKREPPIDSRVRPPAALY